MKVKKISKVALALITATVGLNATSIEINGQIINESEILNISKNLVREDYKSLNNEQKEEALQKIVDMKIVLSEADKMGIENDKKYKEMLQNVSVMLKIQRYTEIEYQNFKLTEEDIKNYYMEEKEQFKKSKSLNASHIVVENPKLAEKIIKELDNAIKKENKFEELAKKYSEGPSSVSGGKLGWFSKNQMVKPFEIAAYNLNKGEYTKSPVKTQFGYHIIFLNDEKIKPAIKYEEFKKEYESNPGILEKYKQDLFQERTYKKLEDLRKNKYKIKVIK